MIRVFTICALVAFPAIRVSSQTLNCVIDFHRNERDPQPWVEFMSESEVIMATTTLAWDTLTHGSSRVYNELDSIPRYDYYVNMIRLDSNCQFKDRLWFPRNSQSGPVRSADGLIFSVGYASGMSPIEVGGNEFVADSAGYIPNGVNNSLICEVDGSLQHLSSVHITSPFSEITDVVRVGDFYYATGSFMDEMKWNGDSINTLEIDQYSRGSSFLAKFDLNLNLIWRKYAHNLPFDFSPSNPSDFRNIVFSLNDLVGLSNGDVAILGVHEHGLEFDGDTIIPVEKTSYRIDALAMTISKDGEVLHSHQFRTRHQGWHFGATSNGQGTMIHHVQLDQFQFEGTTYPDADYLVFYDDTLGVKKVLSLIQAVCVTSSEDGAFYWAGTINDSIDFDGTIVDTQGKTLFMVGKLSDEGKHLWVKTLPTNMRGLAIASLGKQIAVQARVYDNLVLTPGDTLIKRIPGKYAYATLMFEDHHHVGEDEKENPDERIKVFPNPSTGAFHLSHEARFEVFDVLSRRVLSGYGKSIDLSKQHSGIYVVIIDSQHVHKVLLDK